MNTIKTLKSLTIISLCLAAPLSFAQSGTVTNSVKQTAASIDQTASDTAITAKIKAVYANEKVFGDKDVSVTGVKVVTTNGVVYLTGYVDSEDQATNAVKLAKSVKGVNKVVFNLKVQKA